MSKRALELLEQDRPAADESAPAPTPAKQAIAMLEGTADPPILSPEAERASNRKALIERARRGEEVSAEEAGVGYQPPAQTPYKGTVAPLHPMSPMGPARAIADVALSTARGIVRPAAATAAGVWGAMSPNVTYEEARASAEESQRRGEGIIGEPGARTPEGHALEEGIGRAMYYTGIPAAVEHGLGYLESKTNRMTRDIVGTVAELLTLRGGSLAAEGGAAEAAAREGVRVGKDAGAASAVVDLSKASPRLRTSLEAAAKAEGINPEAAARRLNSETLGLEPLTKGQATRDPILWSKERNERLTDERLPDKFSRQTKSAIDKLDEVRRELSPNVVHQDRIQNGQTLIDSYKEFDTAAKADIAAKYKALTDANGGAMPVDGQAFVASADAALKKNRKVYFVPNEIRSLMDEFKEGPMTFDDFETLRTVLATASRGAKDGNVRSAISTVRDALEELPGVPDKLKALADEARAATRERHARIDADPAYGAAADDLAEGVQIGQASALADDFVQKHVVRGKAANLQKMRETLANDPLAAETMFAAELNYLHERSGATKGTVSQDTYNNILRLELAPKFKGLMPAEVIEQLQQLGDYLHDIQKAPEGAGVNYSNTAVAQAGAAAAGAAGKYAISAAEAAINAKTGVGGTVARNFVEKYFADRAERKWVDESLDPGSGVKLNELLQK